VTRENDQHEDERFAVEVIIAGTSVATGVGRRKLDAERMAAGRALELRELPDGSGAKKSKPADAHE